MSRCLFPPQLSRVKCQIGVRQRYDTVVGANVSVRPLDFGRRACILGWWSLPICAQLTLCNVLAVRSRGEITDSVSGSPPQYRELSPCGVHRMSRDNCGGKGDAVAGR